MDIPITHPPSLLLVELPADAVLLTLGVTGMMWVTVTSPPPASVVTVTCAEEDKLVVVLLVLLIVLLVAEVEVELADDSVEELLEDELEDEEVEVVLVVVVLVVELVEVRDVDVSSALVDVAIVLVGSVVEPDEVDSAAGQDEHSPTARKNGRTHRILGPSVYNVLVLFGGLVRYFQSGHAARKNVEILWEA